MIVDAKIKKFGERQFKPAKINLPDECKLAVEKYQIEMVEFPDMEMMSIHFVKDDEDFFTHTIKRHKVPSIMKEGFKNAIQGLIEYEYQASEKNG